jgi:DNA-binding NarL/FixJ family response regulator
MQKFQGSAPQIIFMDLNLPGEKSLQLTKKIRGQFPSVRIALLTSYHLPEYRKAAPKSGAERFFVKDSFSWSEF